MYIVSAVSSIHILGTYKDDTKKVKVKDTYANGDIYAGEWRGQVCVC